MNGQNSDRGRRRKGSDEMPIAVRERLRDRRTLPNNTDAEASVLGGIILKNEALALLPDVETEDFYHLPHRVVWEAMRNLEARQEKIDVVTLEAEIERRGKLEALGGIGFLGELALRVPTVDNIEAYGKIVKGHAITRSAILVLGQLMDEALTGLSEGDQLLHDISTALITIRSNNETPILTMAQLIAEEAQRVQHDVDARLSGKSVFTGVPTGITSLDDIVGGHPIGIMSLYIGRPGMGKSTISMQFAAASSEIADQDTLIASYEDSGQSFGQRGLAQSTGFATDLIRSRRLTAADMIEILAARFAGRSECFLKSSGMTVEALARRVRRENLRRKIGGRKPLKQLIVDYIQKMPMPEWARSRDDGISYISTGLCNLAVAEEMAVVAMCQLNREVEKRDDHRPRLSDIRDSGSLEQDGKLICGLYHPYSYNQQNNPDHELHLLVLKNHQGENYGDISLYWDRKTHAVFNTQLDYHRARIARTQ